MRLLGAAIALVLVLLGAACFAARDAAEPDDASPFLNATGDVAFVGDAACASCHAELYASYQTHGMAQAFYPLTPENAVEDFSGVVVVHEASGFAYRAYRDGARFVQEEFRLGPGGEKTHVLVRPMTYVVGSGSAARTYLAEENGRLYELPLTWYTQAEGGAGRWDFSPGYEVFNARFSRTIPERCMSCHNGPTTTPVPFADGKYAALAGGIGCESCHGPGALHVEARTADPDGAGDVDYTIVNPKHLALERRLDVCQQCHFHGEVTVFREGETASSYRPSRPLSAHRAEFAFASADPARVTVVSHVDRLRMSACFQQAPVDCVTCHNPHEGFRQAGPEYFNRTCRSCHAPEPLQARMPSPALRAQHVPTADCQDCHMPKVPAEDAPHSSFTDHHVRVVRDDALRGVAVPAAGVPELRSVWTLGGADAQAYEGMAYVIYGRQKGERGALERGVGLLRQALERSPTRGEAQFLLGFALAQLGRPAEAVGPLRQAVAVAENPERLNALAQALEASGDRTDEPLRLYERALALQPAAASIRLNYGRLLEARGRLPEALAAYRAAAAEEAWNATAHYNLGTALARTGDLAGARVALAEAVRLQPDHADALTNLGSLLAQAGDLRQAGRLFERAAAVGSGNANAQANYALFLLNSGQPAEAAARAAAALRLDPAQPTARQVMQILERARR
ncbi:MAG: tetratricopeptide repeat protein [Rubricoccaceae bacterium]